MTRYITNCYENIVLPWEPGLIEWLHEHYPRSKYHIVEVSNDHNTSACTEQ
jgi:hypothetical protein